MAHIVAFSAGGARSDKKRSSKDVNSIGNLMLLCSECHKLIDTHPEKYTTETLKQFKQNHEDRIYRLTATHPDRQTTVVVLKSMIGNHAVEVSLPEIQDAIAPRYPDANPIIIDLTTIPDSGNEEFWSMAARTIDQHCDRLYADSLESSSPHHISVFALAPIPLLVHLGSRLTSKIPVDLYQRHRDTENWTWRTDGTPVTYTVRKLRSGSDKAKISMVVSLSGTIPIETLPSHIDSKFTVYELTLTEITPNPGFLRLRNDLISFQRTYQEVLATIIKDHGLVDEIHLFPAVPAPVAVVLGREPLPKVHPALVIYDYNKDNGGFTQTIRSNQL
ncbi:MAG: SAVED domain-containing protein [Nitrospirota bacterium]|nr:SAVED domain-containing protein [Nitrospirota bacterium]